MEKIIEKQLDQLNLQRKSLVDQLAALDPHIMNYAMKEASLMGQISTIDMRVDQLLINLNNS
jgi:hypothetical protein